MSRDYNIEGLMSHCYTMSPTNSGRGIECYCLSNTLALLFSSVKCVHVSFRADFVSISISICQLCVSYLPTESLLCSCCTRTLSTHLSTLTSEIGFADQSTSTPTRSVREVKPAILFESEGHSKRRPI